MDFPLSSANNVGRDFSQDHGASGKNSSIHHVNASAKNSSSVSIDQLFNAVEQRDATSFKALLDIFDGDFSQADNECSKLLHATISSNDRDLLEALVNSPHQGLFDFEAKNLEGQTPLVSVITNLYCPDMIGLLVAAGAKVNAIGEWNETPLYLAASRGSFQMVKALIESHADVSIPGGMAKGTPLFPAVTLKNLDMMRLLIGAGASVTVTDRYGCNPLMSSLDSRIEIPAVTELLIDALLEAKGDLDARDRTGETALVKAIFRERTGAVISLLKAGASFNIPNIHNESPLRLAARYGYSDPRIVKTLIDAGAGVNVQCGLYGETALFDAVLNEHPTIVAQLLDAGADVNIVDGRGNSALTWGVEKGVVGPILEQLVAALLKDNGDMHAVHEHAKKALRIAINKSNSEAVEVLLPVWKHIKPDGYVMGAATQHRHLGVLFAGMVAGFEVSQADLLAALQKEREKSNAYIDLRFSDGATLLIDAAKKGFNSVAETLLGNKEYIEAKDSRGRNAVMYAAENGNLELLEMLRLAGANLHATDNDGANAGLLAAYAQHSAVMPFFAARGALF